MNLLKRKNDAMHHTFFRRKFIGIACVLSTVTTTVSCDGHDDSIFNFGHNKDHLPKFHIANHHGTIKAFLFFI